MDDTTHNANSILTAKQIAKAAVAVLDYELVTAKNVFPGYEELVRRVALAKARSRARPWWRLGAKARYWVMCVLPRYRDARRILRERAK